MKRTKIEINLKKIINLVTGTLTRLALMKKDLYKMESRVRFIGSKSSIKNLKCKT